MSLDISALVGVKTRSASRRKCLASPSIPTQPSIVTPAGSHRRMSASSLRPAFRQGSTDFSVQPRYDSLASSSSCDSSSSSASTFNLSTCGWDSPNVLEPVHFLDTKCTMSQPPPVERPKGNPCLALLHRARTIHIFHPSSRQRHPSRVFPDLPPPPEWDEVSLSIESDEDDDNDAEVLPAMRQKVCFVVPAPPLPTVEDHWDKEPAWSDFM
ncbi:hypothetical protein C8R44DRAFT_728860 [Mycena epipterygia]|nr:hypothetical protein C8R44DRAFT_728860 [Mycena epipterygia]